jgi:hypothetical protein
MSDRIDECNKNIAKDTFVNEKTTGFLKSQLHDLELLAGEWDAKYNTGVCVCVCVCVCGWVGAYVSACEYVCRKANSCVTFLLVRVCVH